MPPKLAVLIGVGLLAGVAAVGLFASARPPVVVTAPPPVVAAVPPATAPRAPGPLVPIDQAIRQLDLIRPAGVKAADDFTVATPSGGHVRLRDLRGKVVMLNFWATWCPPCREEMPAMERLYRRQKDDNFTILAVSLDIDPKVVPPFVSKYGLTFPVAVDPDMAVADRYGVRALPSSFIVDPAGQVTALAIGPRAWDGVASRALVHALAAR